MSVVAGYAFVRSGYVNVNDGKMYNVGQNGNDWSRTSLSSTHAYHLNINPTDVNPSGNSNRWAGFPLRCRGLPGCGADLSCLQSCCRY